VRYWWGRAHLCLQSRFESPPGTTLAVGLQGVGGHLITTTILITLAIIQIPHIWTVCLQTPSIWRCLLPHPHRTVRCRHSAQPRQVWVRLAVGQRSAASRTVQATWQVGCVTQPSPPRGYVWFNVICEGVIWFVWHWPQDLKELSYT